ncbi:MAG: TolC family protein [Opitutales bacterium]
MRTSVLSVFRTGLLCITSVCLFADDTLSVLPEDHFPALKNLLGAAANRKLSREIRESEARAREKASDAYGRTRAHTAIYGAYILEDRENESLETRARLTWEVGAERTLYEFHDAIEARRSLGRHQSKQIDWSERQEESAWLQKLRALFLEQLAAEQTLRTRQAALTQAEDELQALKALRAEGRLAELDLLEAELSLVQLREDVNLSERHISLLETSLQRYTGLSEIPSTSEASLNRLESSSFNTLDDNQAEIPLLRAPAIEQLENNIAVADAQARIAASSGLPRVSSWVRVFQDELQGPEFSGTVTRTNYEAIVGVRWNFWDSGQSRNLARAERLKGQRLERARDRVYASFQSEARKLQFAYESAVSDVRVTEATVDLHRRLLEAQEKASATDAQLLPQALQARVNLAASESSLWTAYATAWEARSAWQLFLHGDPFVER